MGRLVSVWWSGVVGVLMLALAVPASSRGAEFDREAFGKVVLAAFEKEAAKEYAAAFELYSKALEMNDQSPAILIRRAFCGAKIGVSREVARDLKRATEVTPRSRTDFMTLAWFYGTNPFVQFRDGPRAIMLGQKLLRESPSAETYDILAAGYAQMGNFQMARNMILEGLKLYPETDRRQEMETRLALYKVRKPFIEEWVPGLGK
ncbi:MAG: hypothetical protein OHK005_02010 [Candidatus Methylacidiphilales bacterium]